MFCAPSVIKHLIRCFLDGNNSMAKCGSDSPCASSAKKKKYAAKYKPEWATDLQFICHSDKRPTFAYCRVCNTHLNVAHGGKSDLVRHASSTSHSTLQKAISSPTATPTASVCSRCVERSTLTLGHSSATTPCMSCCHAKSTQTILAIPLCQRRISSRPRLRHGIM